MKLYRFFDSWKDIASTDSWDTSWIRVGVIELEEFDVIRETEKCWYIKWNNKEKRVLKGNGKRFAHEKIEWARYSFKKRKRHQLSHLQEALQKVQDVLKITDDAYPTEPWDKMWKVRATPVADDQQQGEE